MDKVLILDANQRSALAATRSLGKKGLFVITADETHKTLAGSSRYSGRSVIYPSPFTETNDFLQSVNRSIELLATGMVLPMTDITSEVILKHKNELPDVIIPLPDYEAYQAVTDKYNLFRMAEALNVPVPETIFVTNAEKLSGEIKHIQYPVVLKPGRSRMLINGTYHSTSVKYAGSEQDLFTTIKENPWFRQMPFLLQEYIRGEGQGIFVLCREGKIIQHFAHRRIREKPPSGGVSVLSESIDAGTEMLEAARSILTPLAWNGVAMVEFKVTEAGRPYLMEVNGRFWGSLQLAVDAKVDFPYLLYRLFTDKNEPEASVYQTGVRLRWLLGDLDHLIILFKDDKISFPDKFKAVLEFLKLIRKNQRYEINRIDDIRPFIFELSRYILDIGKKILRI